MPAAANIASEHTDLLDDISVPIRRRKLLPVWIKIFTWIFLLMGLMVPVCITLGILGYNARLTMYGLETDEPFSWIGIAVMLIMGFKALTAYGLWFEEDWAMNFAFIDAIVGIVICGIVMMLPILLHEQGFNFNLRLDLVVLIPYLIKVAALRKVW